jgi:hypothetical protein
VGNRHKDSVDKFVLVAGVILVAMGLTVVGVFVFLSVALSSWGSNK